MDTVAHNVLEHSLQVLAGRHTRRKIKLLRPQTLSAIRTQQRWNGWHPSAACPGTAGAIVPKPRGSSTKNVSSPGLAEITTTTVAPSSGCLGLWTFAELRCHVDAASLPHEHRKRIQCLRTSPKSLRVCSSWTLCLTEISSGPHLCSRDFETLLSLVRGLS